MYAGLTLSRTLISLTPSLLFPPFAPSPDPGIDVEVELGTSSLFCETGRGVDSCSDKASSRWMVDVLRRLVGNGVEGVPSVLTNGMMGRKWE